MFNLNKHLVLIGFKHVGKSVIGKNLAKQLDMPYIDLDRQIEFLYRNQLNKEYTCREIMHHDGEEIFRKFENAALTEVISLEPSIISLGGGTPLSKDNHEIIRKYIIIHIVAERGIVFERILMSGRPAFFDPKVELLESFNNLWDKRDKSYQAIRNLVVANNGTVADATNEIIKELKCYGA